MQASSASASGLLPGADGVGLAVGNKQTDGALRHREAIRVSSVSLEDADQDPLRGDLSAIYDFCIGSIRFGPCR